MATVDILPRSTDSGFHNLTCMCNPERITLVRVFRRGRDTKNINHIRSNSIHGSFVLSYGAFSWCTIGTNLDNKCTQLRFVRFQYCTICLSGGNQTETSLYVPTDTIQDVWAIYELLIYCSYTAIKPPMQETITLNRFSPEWKMLGPGNA